MTIFQLRRGAAETAAALGVMDGAVSRGAEFLAPAGFAGLATAVLLRRAPEALAAGALVADLPGVAGRAEPAERGGPDGRDGAGDLVGADAGMGLLRGFLVAGLVMEEKPA